MRKYTQKTPATSKLRFKAFETGNEVVVGKNLKVWARGPRPVNCEDADGSSPSKPALNCKQLKSCGKTTSQLYWFEGNEVFKAMCDNTNMGGGWLKVDRDVLTKARAEAVAGTASLSGNTVSLKAKSILEIDLGIEFTEYRMYLSAAKSDGSGDPDDTIGYTDGAFLSNTLQHGTVKYNKNSVSRNGIKLASFTPGNTCENDGTSQVIAWGTDKKVHDMKIGGEFGCNFQARLMTKICAIIDMGTCFHVGHAQS